MGGNESDISRQFFSVFRFLGQSGWSGKEEADPSLRSG
jgi:hypothetical protein